jgi:UDP-N-acetylmuramyl tripeptide synthase
MVDYKNFEEIEKIVITGTKGKTIVANMINHILIELNKSSILVDSTGSYFNNNHNTTYDDSLKNFGRSPNVRPGRYIYWNLKNYTGKLSDLFVVLECSHSCIESGTGVGKHDVGILTNVYDDHIGYKGVKDRDDLLKRKSFVFSQIKDGGQFVSFLDNEHSRESLNLSSIPDSVKKIGATVEINDKKDLKDYLQKYSLEDILYVKNDKLISFNQGELFNLLEYKYYFKGLCQPMIADLLLAYGYLYKRFEIDQINSAFSSYSLPEDYGRYFFFKKGDRTVVLDYAHEAKSLSYIVKLVKNYCKKKPYLITRIDPSKEDEVYHKLAKYLAETEDISGLTIYDKIDGINREVYVGRDKTLKVGQSSKKLFQLINKNRPKVKIIKQLNEQKALKDQLDRKLLLLIHSDLDKNLKLIKSLGYRRVK